jgi:FAD/FMN-containing dehydrogenase
MLVTMADVSNLRDRVTGPVLVKGDHGYTEESVAWIRNFVHTPDVVVGAASSADVVEAVKFAAEGGLAVRIQGTGHGSHVPITDGVLITTKRLDTLEIDPATSLATIGSGLTWDPVIAAAGEHGLAPVAGSSGTVGAVGFLLGGGMGPLVNRYGFGSDWVREFEVVLADGVLVSASAVDHPDLYWALRGGKGGLGVVTSVKIELVSLATLYGGSLTFDAENIEAALHAWVAYLETADPGVTTSVAILRMPDLPVIPEPIRGRTLLSVRFAYAGDSATGEKLAAPLRAAAPVYVDALAEIPASAIGSVHNDPPDPTVGWVRGQMLSHLDDDFATTLLGFGGAGKQVPFVAIEVRAFGPAQATDVASGSAVGGRGAKGSLNVVGAPNPELFATIIPGAAAELLGALSPWISSENNVNFASGFTSVEEYNRAWPPATFERLTEIKKKYDPNALFAFGVH